MTALEADRLLTTGQVGKILDLSRERITQFVNDGRLPSIRVGGRNLIDVADVERLRLERATRA